MVEWLRPFYPSMSEGQLYFSAKNRIKTLRRSKNRERYRILRRLFFLKRSNDMMFNMRHEYRIIRTAIGYIKTGIVKEI